MKKSSLAMYFSTVSILTLLIIVVVVVVVEAIVTNGAEIATSNLSGDNKKTQQTIKLNDQAASNSDKSKPFKETTARQLSNIQSYLDDYKRSGEKATSGAVVNNDFGSSVTGSKGRGLASKSSARNYNGQYVNTNNNAYLPAYQAQARPIQTAYSRAPPPPRVSSYASTQHYPQVYNASPRPNSAYVVDPRPSGYVYKTSKVYAKPPAPLQYNYGTNANNYNKQQQNGYNNNNNNNNYNYNANNYKNYNTLKQPYQQAKYPYYASTQSAPLLKLRRPKYINKYTLANNNNNNNNKYPYVASSVVPSSNNNLYQSSSLKPLNNNQDRIVIQLEERLVPSIVAPSTGLPPLASSNSKGVFAVPVKKFKIKKIRTVKQGGKILSQQDVPLDWNEIKPLIESRPFSRPGEQVSTIVFKQAPSLTTTAISLVSPTTIDLGAVTTSKPAAGKIDHELIDAAIKSDQAGIVEQGDNNATIKTPSTTDNTNNSSDGDDDNHHHDPDGGDESSEKFRDFPSVVSDANISHKLFDGDLNPDDKLPTPQPAGEASGAESDAGNSNSSPASSIKEVEISKGVEAKKKTIIKLGNIQPLDPKGGQFGVDGDISLTTFKTATKDVEDPNVAVDNSPTTKLVDSSSSSNNSDDLPTTGASSTTSSDGDLSTSASPSLASVSDDADGDENVSADPSAKQTNGDDTSNSSDDDAKLSTADTADAADTISEPSSSSKDDVGPTIDDAPSSNDDDVARPVDNNDKLHQTTTVVKELDLGAGVGVKESDNGGKELDIDKKAGLRGTETVLTTSNTNNNNNNSPSTTVVVDEPVASDKIETGSSTTDIPVVDVDEVTFKQPEAAQVDQGQAKEQLGQPNQADGQGFGSEQAKVDQQQPDDPEQGVESAISEVISQVPPIASNTHDDSSPASSRPPVAIVNSDSVEGPDSTAGGNPLAATADSNSQSPVGVIPGIDTLTIPGTIPVPSLNANGVGESNNSSPSTRPASNLAAAAADNNANNNNNEKPDDKRKGFRIKGELGLNLPDWLGGGKKIGGQIEFVDHLNLGKALEKKPITAQLSGDQVDSTTDGPIKPTDVQANNNNKLASKLKGLIDGLGKQRDDLFKGVQLNGRLNESPAIKV